QSRGILSPVFGLSTIPTFLRICENIQQISVFVITQSKRNYEYAGLHYGRKYGRIPRRVAIDYRRLPAAWSTGAGCRADTEAMRAARAVGAATDAAHASGL